MRFYNLFNVFVQYYKPFVIEVINGIIFYKKKLARPSCFTYYISHTPSAILWIIVAIIVVKKTKRFIVGLGGKNEWIFGWGGGCKNTERCVDVMNDVSLGINEVGDVLVAVVEVIREETRRRKEDEWAGGDGFGGIPGVGVIEGVVCALELLDTEIVIVDEALKRFYAIFHCAHFDTAAHAVEGHGDHGVAGLPADGAVFGIVGDRPNAGLGPDEGL